MTYLSPAKLNLSLLVFPPREDGYHPIQSVFQAISLYDSLSFDISKGEGLEIHSSSSMLPCDKRNIFVCGIRFIKNMVDKKITVTIEKYSDGRWFRWCSSNAATFLLYINRQFNCGYNHNQLMSLASSFGADVLAERSIAADCKSAEFYSTLVRIQLPPF